MTGYSPGHRYSCSTTTILTRRSIPRCTLGFIAARACLRGKWDGAISWLQRITRTGKGEGLPWHGRAAVSGNGSPCVKRPSRTSMLLWLSFKIMHMLHFPLFRFSSSRPGEWLQGENVRGTRVQESMSFTTKQRRDSLTALTTLNLSYSPF